MKFVRSKFFIVTLCIAALLVLVPAILTAFGQADLVRSGLKTVAKPFSYVASRSADALSGFISVFSDYDELAKENEALRAELDAIKNDARDNAVLKEENKWLRGFLDIKTASPELELVDATVIAHEAGNFSTVLTLNRGKVHGVKRNMPVISADGVLGYVSEVGLDWCSVTSLIESDSRVGAYTDRTGTIGTVEGDVTLRSEGKCLISYDTGADVAVGDRVYTSGTGSIYPDGLLIGSITEIRADETTRQIVATVMPSVDFTSLEQLRGVMIICGYQGNIEG